jgi:hypothetical protein
MFQRCVLPPSSGMSGKELLKIALMMETIHTSEASVYNETTRNNIPEGSNRENLKFHTELLKQ